ncbi:MAG: ATP-binding protein [Candidatus Handelsmanbacteria bacterium]|nr:ATP-binding protein [Candidatus Handelsmanbacteria bacterium]
MLFEQRDQPALQPLPLHPYQLGHWRQAKVSIDYPIQVDWHYCSVPYLLVHQTVKVRLSVRMVEVFPQDRRVALHPCSHQRTGFTTEAGHRPKAHQKHLQWTPSRLIDGAAKLAPSCGQVVTTLLERKPHPAQGYRACLGILRLAKDYDPTQLEAACQHALAHGACRHGFRALYYYRPKLGRELTVAQADSSLTNLLKKLVKADLLVRDDWGWFPS